MFNISPLVRGLLLAVVLLLSDSAHAAKTVAVIAVAGVTHAHADRLTFAWTQAVTYHIGREGDVITIRFNVPAKFNLQNLVQHHVIRARAFAQSYDRTSSLLSFVVAPETRLSDARHGTTVTVDLIGPRVTVVALPPVPPAVITPLVIPDLPQAEAADVAPAPLPPPPQLAPSPAQTLDAMAPLAASAIKLPAPNEPPLSVLQLNPGIPLALAAYTRGVMAKRITTNKKN